MFDAPGVTLTGGILEGIGTVAANVTNGGEVASGTSPRDPERRGRLHADADGVLVAEVTAAGNDLLDATGMATLDGTLEIETDAGFTPTLGDTFKVVEGSSRSGEFADVNGSGSRARTTSSTTRPTSPSGDLPQRAAGGLGRRRQRREGDAGTNDAGFAVQLSRAAEHSRSRSTTGPSNGTAERRTTTRRRRAR